MILRMETWSRGWAWATRRRWPVLEGRRNLSCGLGRAGGFGEQGAPAAPASWAPLQEELEDSSVSRKAISGTPEEIS